MKMSKSDLLLAFISSLPILATGIAVYILSSSNALSDIYIVSRGGVAIPTLATPRIYILISSTISAIFAALYMANRRRALLQKTLRKQMANLIPTLASYTRVQPSMVKTLEEVSKVVEEPFSNYIYRYVAMVSIGEDPIEAFNRCFAEAPRDVKALLSSISVAMISGGRVSEVLSYAERYAYRLVRFDELRRSRLESYKIVTFLSIALFVFAAVVSTVMIDSMVKSGATLFRVAIDLRYVITNYFISSMIIALVSSIAIARIVHGETVSAYKYTAILSLAIGAVFAVMLSYIA